MEVVTNEKRSNQIDIHTHSTHSDGTFEVPQILEKAEELKLAILAITDHNSVGAYDDIQDKKIREKFKGTILPGCEVTTTYNGEIIEVLGYGFEYEKFREKLAENTLSDRDRTLRKYKVSCITVDTLVEKGVKFRENFGEEIYKNPRQFYDSRHEAVMDAILREIKSFPENAKFFSGKEEMENMTTKEFVRNMVYNPKSEFYIDQTNLYPTLEKVIEIIHDSGGLAFLAHLHVYSKTVEENLPNIVEKYDLDGLECYYTTFTKEQIEKLKEFCKEKGLYMSGGSDFHGARKQNHELGIGSGDLYVPKEIVEKWIDKLKVVYKTNENEIGENTMEEKFEIMPIELKVDAHNHTKGSDGRQSPFKAMLRAWNKGINVIALTDHDSVSGYRMLLQDLDTVKRIIEDDKSYDPTKIIEMLENMYILSGTELKTTYIGVPLEILGYNFDIEKMEEEIIRLKSTAKEKAYEVYHRELPKVVDKQKISFDRTSFDEAYKRIRTEGKGGVVGPFFNEINSHEENQKLLNYKDLDGETKKANNIKLFIDKQLYNKESPFFVDMTDTRPTFKGTIEAIHRAGGQAFLAHAGRYMFDIEKNIDDMIAEGLDGIEVFYPDHSYEFREFLLGKVREHGIKASGGSDDHHSKKEGIQYETGRVAIPDIPETRWIKETCKTGKTFLRELTEIQEIIKELKELKEIRSKKVKENNELDKQINEKQEISR